jgi:Protein O-mannosyl-transferase TMEM260-like
LKFLKKYYWFIAAIFVFIIYQFTLAPSVVEIDSGELATVQALLGIAHPTGYPLFTIIGYLFSLIPFPFSKIYQLNLLASIWCSLGIGIFVYNCKFILENFADSIKVKNQQTNKEKTKKDKSNSANKKLNSNQSTIIVASIFAGLLLAFSITFWDQSTSVEVYSLQIFLINLIILFLLKAYKSTNELKDWLIFSAVLALGFTNHMTTILIIPGTAYLFFEKNKFKKTSFLKVLEMLVVFLIVIIIFYSYLYFRANQNPILDWGNPSNLARLYRHISGKQYQVWMFSSFNAADKQFLYFLNALPKEFNISLFIILIGFFITFKYNHKIFFFLIISFFTTVLYAINYNIKDIDSYFLLAYISAAYFSSFGILEIIKFLEFKKSNTAIPIILIAVFISVEFYFNFDAVNRSGDFIFKDYTKDVLSSVAPNSVILTYQWDYLTSESYYFRYVENYRRDVAVIDKELLRRSWYYKQLERNYPSSISGIHNLINSFKTALIPFEDGGSFDSNLLEKLYREIMTNLVSTNIEKRNFYIAPELFENEMQKGEFTLPKGYTLVPDLFLFKVEEGDSYVPAGDPNFTLRLPKEENLYSRFIEKNVATMLARRALYEIGFDKIDRAKVYLEKIKTDFPNFELPAGLEKVLQN